METIKWHQQPDFKNLYESEINLLENGLGGDLELVTLIKSAEDERIIFSGRLKFGNTDTKQAIKIIFPTKYPFKQPVIFPLMDGQNGITQQPKFFGKGNQYSNGSMCLMRSDQWNRHKDNIGSLLRRAQRWLVRATSPDGFPKEEIVEEIPAIRPHSGQVIMAHSYEIPTNANVGTITLTQFKPNYYILEENVLPTSPFLLKINKEDFKWYAFKKGVERQIIFPDFNIQTILRVLKENFGEEFPNLVKNPNVAFYIPDDPNPWYFFKFLIAPGGIVNIIYFLTRIVDRELYHRTKEIFNDQILLKKKVTIIGLGAIGSEVAVSLARNGVGHFNLFDKDIFEMGNSVRHAADLFYIGENKTSVIRQLIHRSNPNITVVEYPNTDILDDDGFLEKSLENSDLCIVLTGEEDVDYLINDFYIPRTNIPFVFAGVSAGGLSGSIQVVKHGKTACLRCLAKYGADVLPLPNTTNAYKELGPEYGSCSTPAVPGSEIDTKEIALQVSRISLQLLLEGNNSAYADRLRDQFYWNGPFGSKQQAPFSWEIKKFEKHNDCELCNP
jgi:molybdopterin/thiamine biosynthesis adenylyltransferase